MAIRVASERAEGFTEQPKRPVELLHGPLAKVDPLLNVADQKAPE
jgi:hypothetical protein